MQALYLESFSTSPLQGICLAPLETAISLFLYKYCGHPPLSLFLVASPKPQRRAAFKLKLTGLSFEAVDEKNVEGIASFCELPTLVSEEGNAVVAGLCGVLRQILKTIDPKHPLLGFKQSCLYACAESSLWTKFCEVDIVTTVNELYDSANVWTSERVDLPKDVARFEVHMSQPVKIHNIQKEKQDLARSEGFKKHPLPDSRLAPVQELDHKYAEGHKMTVADVMLFPSFHIVFEFLGSVYLKQHLPLSFRWYENLRTNRNIKNGLQLFLEVEKKFEREIHVNYVVPDVGSQSLYKGEVKKFQPKRHHYTRQEDIEECLEKVSGLERVRMREETFGKEIDFDWKTVPFEEGNVPAKRLERKGQQLENMTKAVLKISREGDRIVDFCSGSGHLGLILAHALPRCSIVLLENKEQSLTRAKDRAAKLKLWNVFFCQSNVDYFKGEFDIGVSLHACGVATDLVIEKCMNRNAGFVCCPCCYGSIQPNHVISYPRSKTFRSSKLTLKEYLILGHASDQTHGDGDPKTSQGNQCMAVIDSDRCLRAQDAGYTVFLSKLHPASCTPKNNLLVGVPSKRKAVY